MFMNFIARLASMEALDGAMSAPTPWSELKVSIDSHLI
jgi:hypothetical protein